MAHITRRETLAAGAMAAVSALAPGSARAQSPAPSAVPATGKVVKKGRLKQSVSRWCYRDIPDPELYKAVNEMGLRAMDLLEAGPGRSWASWASSARWVAGRRHDSRRAQRPRATTTPS